jgi:ADP-ribose pyrophosphatase
LSLAIRQGSAPNVTRARFRYGWEIPSARTCCPLRREYTLLLTPNRTRFLNDPEPEPSIEFEGQFLRLRKKGRWEYVERHKASGIVAILPITDQGEIVLVEQFRIPVGRRVLEIPAGIAGDLAGQESEALADAARREGLEETGYEAESMKFLTEGPPSAGLSTEFVTFFRARGLKKVGEGGGDGSENIVVHLVPLQELDAWIAKKRAEGCLVDYKIYAALYFGC